MLQQAYEIIANNKLPPSDAFSIITFNTLQRLISSNQNPQQDVCRIHGLLHKYVSSFTKKQKDSLKNAYTKICHFYSIQPDPELLKKYEELYAYKPTIREENHFHDSKPSENSSQYGFNYLKKKNNDYEIKKSLGDLIGDVRMCLRSKNTIDPEVVGERLMDLFKEAEESVFY